MIACRAIHIHMASTRELLFLSSFVGIVVLPAFGLAQTRTDLYGDPLPTGALTRLGTVRFRHPNGSDALAFTPDGRFVAGGSPVYLWDVATGKVARQFPTPHTDFGYEDIVISPDGKLIAAAAGLEDSRVYLWDLATGRELRQWRAPEVPEMVKRLVLFTVKRLEFSPDSRWLAGCRGGRTVLWDVTSGQELREIGERGEEVHSIAFSIDGRRLVAISDKTARFWDPATGESRRVLRLSGASEFAAVSRDQKLIATGGSIDNPIRLWDVEAGKIIREFNDDRLFWCTAFAPDDRCVVGLVNGKATFWDVTTAACGSRFPLRLTTSGDSCSPRTQRHWR